MTRLVVAFFLCITFLLTVTWIVPGARPPDMTALAPASLQKPAPSSRVAVVEPPAAPEPARPAAVDPRPAAAAPAPAAPRTAQGLACDGDPIRCMLEGRAVAADPTDVTGSVVAPRKAPAKPAAHHPAKP
jgi:hypothetical protein